MYEVEIYGILRDELKFNGSPSDFAGMAEVFSIRRLGEWEDIVFRATRKFEPDAILTEVVVSPPGCFPEGAAGRIIATIAPGGQSIVRLYTWENDWPKIEFYWKRLREYLAQEGWLETLPPVAAPGVSIPITAPPREIPPHPLKSRRETVLKMSKDGIYTLKEIATEIKESVDVVKQDKFWLKKGGYL